MRGEPARGCRAEDAELDAEPGKEQRDEEDDGAAAHKSIRLADRRQIELDLGLGLRAGSRRRGAGGVRRGRRSTLCAATAGTCSGAVRQHRLTIGTRSRSH